MITVRLIFIRHKPAAMPLFSPSRQILVSFLHTVFLIHYITTAKILQSVDSQKQHEPIFCDILFHAVMFHTQKKRRGDAPPSDDSNSVVVSVPEQKRNAPKPRDADESKDDSR